MISCPALLPQPTGGRAQLLLDEFRCTLCDDLIAAPRQKLVAAEVFPFSRTLQPFSQKSRTPTVAKEFQIGLYDPAEADLEIFCNSWSAGFLGERL